MKKSFIAISGTAAIDSQKKKEYFQFTPDDPEAQELGNWRRSGVAQMLRDGTFAFMVKSKARSSATLLKMTKHGRLSLTKDGALQLTLKIFKIEGLPMAETFMNEAAEAVDFLNNKNNKI